MQSRKMKKYFFIFYSFLLFFEISLILFFHFFFKNEKEILKIIVFFIFSINLLIILLIYLFFSKFINLLNKNLNFKNKTSNIIFDTQLKKYIIFFIDKKLKIYWVNDIYYKLGFENIVGYNIEKFHSDLKDINVQKKNIIIKKNNSIFKCYYYPETKSLILEDITKLKQLEEFLEDNKYLIYSVSIDNYTKHILIEQKFNIFELQNEINIFFNNFVIKNNLTLLKFEITDNLLLLSDKKTFNFFKKNNFSFIASFHEKIKKKYNINLFLSIGVSEGSKIYELQKYINIANNMLFLSKTRGGNQIVIKYNNEEIDYMTSKIKPYFEDIENNIENFLIQFINEINISKNIYICGHTNTDYDSLSSILLIANWCINLKKNIFIYLDIENMEKKMKKILNTFLSKNDWNIFILEKTNKKNKVLPLNKTKNLLIIVDTNSAFKIDIKDFKNFNKKIIIDHHRKNENSINTFIEYVDTKVSSTAEILINFMRYNDNLNKNIITEIYNFLLAGIMIDTNRFIYNTYSKTLENVSWLQKQGAKVSIVNNWLTDSMKNINKLNDFIVNKEKKYIKNKKILFIYDDNVNNLYDNVFIAKVANYFISKVDLIGVFVLCNNYDNNIIVSGRSRDIDSLNIQHIFEQYDKEKGGGHFNVGALVINQEKNFLKIITILENIIQKKQ